MSHIRTIYNAVAALDLGTIDGEAITVYHLNTLRESMESAHLPARILSVYGALQPGGASITEITTLAGNRAATWTVTDLLLARTSEEGIGLEDIVDALLDYAAAYSDTAPSLRGVQWRLTNWTMQPGVINWPQGGATYYDGVAITLTFSEV